MLKKQLKRLQRKNRVRSKIFGNRDCPRLCVFRSNKNISAQLIDDDKSETLAYYGDLKIKKDGTKTHMATKVGEEISKKIKDLNIKSIVFDRSGFAYHGRVKALADSIRKSGIKF